MGNKENKNRNNSRTARRRDTARSKSRTRNGAYKKPMSWNETKEKLKSLRKQLSEVNEAHDRLYEEKRDLEDELNDIQERNSFDIEIKDKKIKNLQREKIKFENQNKLNQEKINKLQNEIKC